MNKFKVGDKVKLRDDLEVGRDYGGITFLRDMKDLQGKELTIDRISRQGNYILKEGRFYYSEENSKKFGDLCRFLAQNKVPYNMVESKDLEKLCGSVHHQGVVVMIEEKPPVPLTASITTSWIESGESALLLDRVGNANNLGAIARSAAFFGIKNIILPINESQSLITTSTYRVAQGGMEYVNMYSIRSVVRLLQDMKDKMYRIGTDVRATTPLSKVNKGRNNKPVLVVLGNEEHGISQVVKDNCDCLVVIPSAFSMSQEKGKGASNPDSWPVESLNVAQASAIILYEITKN